MKKKLIIGGVIALFGLIGIAGSSSPTSQSQQTPLVQSAAPASSNSQPDEQPAAPAQPVADPTPAPAPSSTSSSSSTSGTYTNVDGNTVQSPTQSADGSVPAGATARCGDGSYSFSQHHSGTCSHHGGVSEWL